MSNDRFARNGPLRPSLRPFFLPSRASWALYLRVTVVILAGVVVSAATWSVYALRSISPATGPSDLLALIIAPAPQPQSLAAKASSNERINVLLLAHGGSGNDNPNYTDTLIVVSIRPRSGQVTLISLPRYLWVEIPALVHGSVEGKLYSAFALGVTGESTSLRSQWRTSTGAGDLAAATVAATIGQTIDYWVAIDTNAFAAIIDAIGGIRVTVPNALDDSHYPVDDSVQTMHVHFDAGPQTLSGQRALAYARSRLTTSDADRSVRQELVLGALIKAVRIQRPGPGLISALGPMVAGLRTNLRPLDMQELARLLTAVRVEEITRVTLADSPLLETQVNEAGEVVLPRGGSYAALQRFLSAQLP